MKSQYLSIKQMISTLQIVFSTSSACLFFRKEFIRYLSLLFFPNGVKNILGPFFRIIMLMLLTTLLYPDMASARHGISIDGQLKYPADFKRFAYTSKAAKSGGDLVLHDLGSFDKMNPFTLKGSAPAGIGELVFEPLAEASLDEPFARYGLIAQDIDLAKDGMSVTFTIDKRARFSDNSKITAADVKFSLDTLKSPKAHPFYQSYFNDIIKATIIDTLKVRFTFAKKNRELHLVACELPVFSKKFFQSHPFDSPDMTPPIGSGPYIIDKIVPGKQIAYRKNPNYWAADHPTRRGFFNFKSITYKYYKDQLVSVEAFKAHEFDFMAVNIAKQWVRDLSGQKFSDKTIIKDLLPHKNNAGMQSFVMNLRKELFQDRKVRQALGLAFDFTWTNKSLFFEQYTQSNSFFSNSPLAGTAQPEGLELSYLTPFKESLPPEVFTTPIQPVSTLAPNSLRKNLRQAKKLLHEAGWGIINGKLYKNGAESQPFKFEILLASPSFERVMAPYVNNLKKIGIEASYRTIDPALYVRRVQTYDFDMVVNVFGQSQSPGNEQRDYWHSSSADQEGSKNLIGLKDPVIDQLVEKIIYATTQEELTAACKALDRVLWYGYYVVPNWYVAKHRVTYWNTLHKPKTPPTYYSPSQAIMTWWFE